MSLSDFIFFTLYGWLIFILILIGQHKQSEKIELLITKNHAEYMRIETEKQKTMAEFLRSVKTGKDNR